MPISRKDSSNKTRILGGAAETADESEILPKKSADQASEPTNYDIESRKSVESEPNSKLIFSQRERFAGFQSSLYSSGKVFRLKLKLKMTREK